MVDDLRDPAVESAGENAWLDRFEIRHLRRHELGSLEWNGEFKHFRRQFENAFQNQRRGIGVVWVAVRRADGLLAGQVFVLLSSQNRKELADGRERAYLYAIRVKPEFRGRGIGGRLMSVVEADLAARGYRVATLNVARDNPDAHRFYLRCGYRVVAPEPGQWSYIDHLGRRRHVDEPAWRLEKVIGSED